MMPVQKISFKTLFNRYFYLPLARSLRLRLLVFFLILAFIPAMVTGLLSFRISSGIVYEMAADSSVEMIDRISQELNNLFSDTIYFMYHVQEMPALKQGIRNDFESIEKRYLTDFNVSSELQFISDYKKEIFGMYVLGENKSKFKSNYYTFKEDDLRHSQWYTQIIASDSLMGYGPYKDSLTIKTAPGWGMEFFSLGIPFTDRFTGNRQGVILAEFEKSLIMEIINSTLGKTGYILLLDNNNQILLSPNGYKEKIDFKVLPVLETENFEDLIINQRFLGSDEMELPKTIVSDRYILIYQFIDIPNWKVIGVIPYRERDMIKSCG